MTRSLSDRSHVASGSTRSLPHPHAKQILSVRLGWAAAGVVDDGPEGERRATTDPARSGSEDRKPATRDDRPPARSGPLSQVASCNTRLLCHCGTRALLSGVKCDVIGVSSLTGGWNG